MQSVEPKVVYNNITASLEGKEATTYTKYLSDMKAVYKSVEGLDDNQLMYTVHAYGDSSQESGHLMWAITVLEALTVNKEYNMTRGHFHQDKQCDEMYFGLEGEGLLLFLDLEDNFKAEKIFPGSIHYIKGDVAHRIVNTGTTKCVVGASYHAIAGHDYQTIEDSPFPYRIYKDKDTYTFVEE